MNRKIFETCVSYFNQHKAARNTLFFFYKGLPLLLFLSYPSLLIYALIFWQTLMLAELTLVPLGVFLGVTLLRVLVNEQRPYERFGQPSVFHKDTSGKSFPSRHTASAFIIAMAFLRVDPVLGTLMLLFAVIIGLSRILSGAHYIHDVVTAMLISVAAGYIFFFIF